MHRCMLQAGLCTRFSPSTSCIVNQPRRPLHPARGRQRAARERGAIAGRMRQRNRFGRSVEADRVRAGNVAGARRRHVDRPRVAGPLHRALQQQRRARRRVLLGRVMGLVQPRAELGLPRRTASPRARRSPRTARRRSRNSAPRRCRRRPPRRPGERRLVAARQPVVPIDEVDAAPRERRHVGRHRVGRREIDRDVDAASSAPSPGRPAVSGDDADR